MEPIKSFEDLDVWRVGREIRKDLYRLANQLPKIERYCLGQQLRTAAISLAANIAEGFGRFHFKENIQFCRMARGTVYELLDHLIACKDQSYLDEVQHKDLRGSSFDLFSSSTVTFAALDMRPRKRRRVPSRMTINE